MSTRFELPAEKLTWRCDLSFLPFACTAEMTPLEDFIGHTRESDVRSTIDAVKLRMMRDRHRLEQAGKDVEPNGQRGPTLEAAVGDLLGVHIDAAEDPRENLEG